MARSWNGGKAELIYPRLASINNRTHSFCCSCCSCSCRGSPLGRPPSFPVLVFLVLVVALGRRRLLVMFVDDVITWPRRSDQRLRPMVGNMRRISAR